MAFERPVVGIYTLGITNPLVQVDLQEHNYSFMWWGFFCVGCFFFLTGCWKNAFIKEMLGKKQSSSLMQVKHSLSFFFIF